MWGSVVYVIEVVLSLCGLVTVWQDITFSVSGGRTDHPQLFLDLEEDILFPLFCDGGGCRGEADWPRSDTMVMDGPTCLVLKALPLCGGWNVFISDFPDCLWAAKGFRGGMFPCPYNHYFQSSSTVFNWAKVALTKPFNFNQIKF